MEKKRGGNKRPQTFRDCKQCGQRFGPLERLSRVYCSKDCWYKTAQTIPSKKLGKKYPHLQRAETRDCEYCKKPFRAVKDFKTKKQKYCSAECFQKVWTNKIQRRIILLRDKKFGIDNPEWKGEEASYASKHKWIERVKGTPSKCEHCKTTTARKFEWANIDHEYRRNKDDYMRLCTKCHRKYDISMGIQGNAKEYRLKKVKL